MRCERPERLPDLISLLPVLPIAALLLLASPAAAQDGLPEPFPAAPAAPAAETAGAAPRVDVVPAVEDGALAARLETILQTTGWFDNAAVAVRNGVVFLDGTADSREHRQWATSLAGNAQGAVAVVNRLEVQSDATATFRGAGAELRGFFQTALLAWPVLVVALLILAVAWLASRLVARAARRFLAPRIGSPLLLRFVARAISIPVFLLGLYFVLQVAGLTRLAVTVLGGTGLLGIVVGFAFRDIAENFLASLLLSVRNPFRSGDLIEVEGHTGVVQNLNTRSTVLLTLDGTHVQIPNAIIYKSTVTNYSSNPSRRAEFLVGIGYDSSAAEAQAIIAGVLREHPAVLDAPEPLVLVDELGPASVNLRVFYWFDTAAYSPAKINSAVLRLSKNALLRAGIEMPDPAREIIFPRGVPIVNADRVAAPASGEAAAPASALREDTTEVTESEGGLSNETRDVRIRSDSPAPGAAENLLKQ